VGGTAADWWRQVSESADIVYEAYYDAPNMIRRGPVMANRRMRLGVRELVDLFGSIGVQPERLGIMLGFHSAQTPGIAGRQGLQPREAWFRVVKWEALTAREVATDERLSTVWSWGWGTFGPESVDADKADAACVWLWTRNTALCDAPAAVGPAFDTSLAEGQIVLPPRAACTFAGGNVSRAAVARLAAFTRDPRAALTAQFARASMRRAVAVSSEEVVAAEQAAIARSFHGSRSAYLQALQRRHATVQVARGAIADELRRRALPALLARTDPTQTPFGWTIARESRLADTATCRDDVLPGTGDFPASDARDVGVMPLPARLPFLFRDHAAPAAPAQPAATPKGAQITLTWTPGREADLAGYDVLRSLDGGPYTKLNAAPLQRLDYVDVLPAPAAAATYVIRARDSSGNLSPLSPSASSVDTLERARHQ
jgi:hypothetical protein